MTDPVAKTEKADTPPVRRAYDPAGSDVDTQAGQIADKVVERLHLEATELASPEVTCRMSRVASGHFPDDASPASVEPVRIVGGIATIDPGGRRSSAGLVRDARFEAVGRIAVVALDSLRDRWRPEHAAAWRPSA